jgi:hypothetical protein
MYLGIEKLARLMDYIIYPKFLTHSVKLPCGKKPERPEKTHDFRQSVDRLLSRESVARIEATNSEVKDACSNDCATEAPLSRKEGSSSIIPILLGEVRPINYQGPHGP